MGNIFVTGIDTNVGKTVVSSILVEALVADYWKPIQSGDLHMTDTMKVKELVSGPRSRFFPERHRLKEPLSPHQAAALENVTITCSQFELPKRDSRCPLIIEGAGGVLVPLNDQETMLDLMKRFNVPIIVVSKNYLGSLNHTQLTVNALKWHGMEILGLVFNGQRNMESENFLLKKTGLRCLGRMEYEECLTPLIVRKYAHEWKELWDKENWRLA